MTYSCTVAKTYEVEKPGFWAANFESGYYEKVEEELKFTGTYCKIYIEKSRKDDYASTMFQNVAIKFDTMIYQKITDNFGGESDVNNDGKITIFILDIKDGGTLSSYTAGYFDPVNLYSKSSKKASNEQDMIYMDCVEGSIGSDNFYQTIAHEFQHMINYHQKVFVQSGIEQDTWINEGLSSAAETISSEAINSDKLNYYNTDPYNKISQGKNFLTWRDGEYANYATVYLFFQWLRIQSTNGNGAYKEIINDTNSNYLAVLDIAQSRIYNNAPTTWETVLGDWFIANLINWDVSGKHWSYKNGNSLQITNINPPPYTGTSSVSLNPGDGIYKTVSSNPELTDTGDNVHFYFNTSSRQIVTSGGNYLLCFNKNGTPSLTSTSSTGALPASIMESTPLLSQKSAKVSSSVTDQKKYPVDRVINSTDGFKIKE